MVRVHHLEFVPITVQFTRNDACFADRKLLSRPTAIPAKKCQRDVIAPSIRREDTQWRARVAATAMIHDSDGKDDVLTDIGDIQTRDRLAIGPTVWKMIQNILHPLQPKPLQRLGKTGTDTL
jgi:hypothetical protein